MRYNASVYALLLTPLPFKSCAYAHHHVMQVEQEEEYLVNNLQRRLAKVLTGYIVCGKLLSSAIDGLNMQVNEEKATLESRLTTEQEYLDNQLHKKVCIACVSTWQKSGTRHNLPQAVATSSPL